ncbi:MAG: lamin tail domain-containing protein, partial [Nitrosopumilaceae archaeon]|nr:lamin tail domain-containing protein [Nitrosopumilaceae archaeon]
MKRPIAILFSIILLSGASAASFAQTSSVANHVVINEVDTNPPGDDAVNISEWVELYNPTSSTVDLSGWKIASTTVLKKTMTIPSGTVIEPGKFKIFSYQQSWFTDISEVVELTDKSGQVIDKTPLITDVKNDFTSWQRIYDGYDTDNITDWKYVLSNAGSSNGKITTQTTTDEVTISVNSNKENYIFGETVTLSGSVSKKVTIQKPYFQPAKIILTVTGPNYHNQLELYPDLNLKYKTTLNLHKVLGFNEGVYDVSVTYAGASDDTVFSLGNVVIQETETSASELSINTNKDSYMPGETVTIFGKTTDMIPFEGLKFIVVNPNGAQIFDGTLFPNTNGEFTTKFFLSTVNPVYGEYTITGEYFDQAAKSSFTVAKDVKEDTLISLWTDKDVYGLGETVKISGRLNNLWTPTFDLDIVQTTNKALGVKDSSGGGFLFKIKDAVRLNGDGTFSYEFKIPAKQDRLGEYQITVSKDIGSKSKSIVVVSNPETYVPSTEPFSLKTNKQVYDLGDTMKISGVILNPKQSSTYQTPNVMLSFLKSDGKPVTIMALPDFNRSSSNRVSIPYEMTAIPDKSGFFSITADVKPGIFSEGKYTIKAQYLDLKTSTTIDVVKPLITDGEMIVSLNKDVYGLGDTVTLSGIVPPSAEQGISITLFKPDGSKRESGATINNQQFAWEWKTPISATIDSVKSTEDRSLSSSNIGVYKIIVSTKSLNKSLFFKVSEDPVNDTLVIPPLSVTTAKPIYHPGEKLKVTGEVIKREQGTEGLVVPERVAIKVLSGKFPHPVIHEASVYPNQGGAFESLFELPATIFPTGEYIVKANYVKKQAETRFSVANDFVFGIDGPVSLIATTDKAEYYPGDTVLVTGKPNKLIYLETYKVSVIKK